MTKKRIVILDAFTTNPGDLNWSEIEQLGDLTVYDRTSKEDVAKRIKDVPFVFTNEVPITQETIKECPSLKFVGVLATGYNIVDLEACRRAGIAVCNIPNYSSRSVAQLTIALLLEIANGVGELNTSVHKGDWQNCKDFCYTISPLIELDGKTLGIIGFGKIGQLCAATAMRLGMKVLYNCPHRKPQLENENCHFAALEELFATSDVISLHCPLCADTQNMISKSTIARMKDGVVILNTGRGGLVVEEDLAAALSCGKVYAAGVDVVSAEPVRADNPLLKAPRCIMTPHIGWASKEARVRLIKMAAENLKAFMNGNPVNVVS